MTPRTRININYEVAMTLTEPEVRALDALAGYGIDSFLTVFYRHMGRNYLQPHEAGLRSLFKAIGAQVRPELAVIDTARKGIASAFEGDAKKCP